MNKKLINKLSGLPIITAILNLLERDLSARLVFHSASHTRDVLAEAISFASDAKLTPREIELIAIAAAYHDAGFLKQDSNNERIGATMATDAMKTAGDYSTEEILLVNQMILDTEIKQVNGALVQESNSPLSPYLLDADLSNLGRDDFFERIHLMFAELNEKDEKAFLRSTLKFIEAHEWKCAVARNLRQSKKDENIIKLRELCR